jgi:ABC-type glycerol-3-phosphate transport system substrate-binding protein
MNKRFKRALALAAGLVLLAGCAAVGPEITTDYDSSADFSQYRTFQFMSRDERGVERSYDTIADRRLISAVTREMEARGYRRVAQDADLLVNFAVSTEEVEDLRTVPSSVLPPPWYGYRSGYYYDPWPAYTYETRIDRYERGTLFIDLVDAQRRQLVWEGRAVARVTREAREDPGAALDQAVSDIFARYPFTAGPASR